MAIIAINVPEGTSVNKIFDLVATIQRLGFNCEAVEDGKVASPEPTVQPTAPEQPAKQADKGSRKQATKPTASAGKGKSTPKVLRVDKNGLQWIAEYNEAAYRAESQRLFGKDKPGKDKREQVYRSLGWIL